MANSMVAALKGISFLDVTLFTRHKFGAEGWDAVYRAMSREDQHALASVVSVGWYELPLYARLLRQLADVHGGGSLRIVEECGRFGVEHDLKTVHKIFMRMASPAFILDQAMQYWGRFQNSGEWKIERTPSGCTGTLSGWAVDDALCSELSGYLAGLLSHGNGGESVRVMHPRCRARGAFECVFVSNWR
jgi:predicted hydrocarbon binding protein